MSAEEITLALPYLVIMAVIWAIYVRQRNKKSRHNLNQLAQAKAAGLAEPASLHPLIDHARCIGCGSCVEACPEKTVIGLINGKATLVNPSLCIGHGACRTACPTGSIALVFGTEKRGVDIPFVSPDFETNVPGIFIAGELGGMGLIRNAVTQGVQVIEAIAKRERASESGGYDVVIVGAGPAGIAAALAAKARKLSYVVLEQDELGGTIAHYPRGKLVMTAPATLPLVGEMRFKETTKEALMEFWYKVCQEQDLNIHYQTRVDGVVKEGSMFNVTTPTKRYRGKSLLLAIGRRGTPRKLGVTGEDLPKVVYRLIDPAQYHGQHVLVVGGGDSALEAACSLAELGTATVTLSYRGDGFSRAKGKNRERVAALEQTGQLRVMLNSNALAVRTNDLDIEQSGQTMTLPNQAIIVCAGGILPTPFLKSLGIEVETKYGTA